MRRNIQQRGFTLVEIMIVVAIIGILIAIAVPGFIRARRQAQGQACSENLAKIEGAKDQWALETNHSDGDTIDLTDLYSADGSGYLKGEPVCPSGGDYTTNVVGTEATCSEEDGELHALR